MLQPSWLLREQKSFFNLNLPGLLHREDERRRALDGTGVSSSSLSLIVEAVLLTRLTGTWQPCLPASGFEGPHRAAEWLLWKHYILNNLVFLSLRAFLK